MVNLLLGIIEVIGKLGSRELSFKSTPGRGIVVSKSEWRLGTGAGGWRLELTKLNRH